MATDSDIAYAGEHGQLPTALIPRRRGDRCRPQQPAAGESRGLSLSLPSIPSGQLRQVLTATALMTLAPVVLTLVLRFAGIVSSPWVAMGISIALSIALTHFGGLLWSRYKGAGELLFSELMLWGWLAHRRRERQLSEAVAVLERQNGGAGVELRSRMLQQLASVLEGRDLYLNGHSRRVARHAVMIARGMGMSPQEVSRIHVAAAVHDIGKLETPSEVLNLPRKLTDEEFAIIKRHPVDGARMVEMLNDPKLTEMVRHHHERLDGRGYPDGLAGEQIPLGARIISVADTFDAITSARAYRGASAHVKALDILRKEAGTQLDPHAVEAFLNYYSGHRPTLLWSSLGTMVRRLGSWLSGSPAFGATWSSKFAAVAATAAVGGAAAGGTPVVAAIAHTAPAAVSSTVRSSAPAAAASAPHSATVAGAPAAAGIGHQAPATPARSGVAASGGANESGAVVGTGSTASGGANSTGSTAASSAVSAPPGLTSTHGNSGSTPAATHSQASSSTHPSATSHPGSSSSAASGAANTKAASGKANGSANAGSSAAGSGGSGNSGATAGGSSAAAAVSASTNGNSGSTGAGNSGGSASGTTPSGHVAGSGSGGGSSSSGSGSGSGGGPSSAGGSGSASSSAQPPAHSH